MTDKYNFRNIEEKWQKKWEETGVFRADSKSKKEKYYCLIEFPYPSGEGLHTGHPRSYTAMDIIARKRRMEGKNVLYPIGWDAFGLPAENYAIKTGIHPSIATEKNINNFRRQLKRLGFSFDWSREINTTDQAYYKWTQWMFLQFVKHDMAYKAKVAINWCPKDKTGLANEEVVNGCCERCGTSVEKREKEQWMIRITKYADRLLEGLEKVDYLPRIKEQQKNWIGRSEGAEIDFTLKGIPGQEDGKQKVTVFTTRPDTIFGATFLVISPEFAQKWMDIGWQASAEVRAYVETALKREEIERAAEGKEKTGVDAGIVATNPASGKDIPVWVADYALGGYGTGAIMAVPAHDERDFEFAEKYNLPVKQVVEGRGEDAVFIGEGLAINSDFLDGLPTQAAKEKITAWLEKEGKGKKAVQYKLRDWVFSRQRYWGEPIPMVYCEACGWVSVPEKDLPVELPKVEKYQPTDNGESPLASVSEWVNVECPKCGGKAKRETDTMPNWAGSSWYFLRYCDPENKKEFASQASLKYWMGSQAVIASTAKQSRGIATSPTAPRNDEIESGGVDWYNGGMEHTVLHLLYSRFWYKFLYDIGVIPKECGDEPYKKRTSHGLILGEGGEKMSKSRGNVVNPDDVVGKFGADAFRLYEMFMGPFDQPIPWDTNGLVGCVRFLEKVWRLQGKITLHLSSRATTQVRGSVAISYGEGIAALPAAPRNDEILRLTHKTLKKVSEHIEEMRFNTAISAMMILVNEMEKARSVAIEDYTMLLTMLSPFAPHVTEELYSRSSTHPHPSIKVSGGEGGVMLCQQPWPEYDPKLVKDEEIDLVVQVNGKMRDTVRVAADIDETGARSAALASEKVQKFIGGKEVKRVIFVRGRLINFII